MNEEKRIPIYDSEATETDEELIDTDEELSGTSEEVSSDDEVSDESMEKKKKLLLI